MQLNNEQVDKQSNLITNHMKALRDKELAYDELNEAKR